MPGAIAKECGPWACFPSGSAKRGLTFRVRPRVKLKQDKRKRISALHSAGGVAGSQRLDLGNADQIEVVLDAVLEAGGGYREIDGVLRGLSVQHGIDKARAEGVAAADAVNDMDVIGRREVSLAQSLSLAEREPRSVMATALKPKRAQSCSATER